jgi:DNA polymerase-3 subunit delta'
MSTDSSFFSLVGQEQARTILDRIFASGRLAHAYLFRGPDGVGKKRAALLTAARLNCAAPGDNGACGNCPSCRKLRSGNHPDVVVVSAENGTIKIDRIRDLCRSLAYPPYESEMRAVIIEDVHTMTPEAANSLLKTLEEPPPRNLLILTAESSRELLPTIVSRCQAIPFYGLAVETCARVVLQQCPDLGSEEVLLLAELAGGSPGTALLLQQKELLAVYHRVRELLAGETLEATDTVTALLETAATLAALKEDLPLVLGLLRIWIRDQMLADERGAQLHRLRLNLSAVEEAQRQLDRNCNRVLICEVLLFNLQSPGAAVS